MNFSILDLGIKKPKNICINNQLIVIHFALVMANINKHPYFIDINTSHC